MPNSVTSLINRTPTFELEVMWYNKGITTLGGSDSHLCVVIGLGQLPIPVGVGHLVNDSYDQGALLELF